MSGITPTSSPQTSPTKQPAKSRIPLAHQESWLHYVKTYADPQTAENLSRLADLAKRIPFTGQISPEVQCVIDSVKQVVETQIFDDQLCAKAAAALNTLHFSH